MLILFGQLFQTFFRLVQLIITLESVVKHVRNIVFFEGFHQYAEDISLVNGIEHSICAYGVGKKNALGFWEFDAHTLKEVDTINEWHSLINDEDMDV